MPPGRVRCRLLRTKWLWTEWRPGLCTGSLRANRPKGTLPTAASKNPSGARVSAKLSARTVLPGYSARQIAAVVGSSSTPVISAPGGRSL